MPMARALRNALTRGICAPDAAQRQSKQDRKARKGPGDGVMACGHRRPFPLLARRSACSRRPARSSRGSAAGAAATRPARWVRIA